MTDEVTPTTREAADAETIYDDAFAEFFTDHYVYDPEGDEPNNLAHHFALSKITEALAVPAGSGETDKAIADFVAFAQTTPYSARQIAEHAYEFLTNGITAGMLAQVLSLQVPAGKAEALWETKPDGRVGPTAEGERVWAGKAEAPDEADRQSAKRILSAHLTARHSWRDVDDALDALIADGWAPVAPIAVQGEGDDDPRDVAHIECDCIPDIGPSHCHLCGRKAGHPVAWSEAHPTLGRKAIIELLARQPMIHAFKASHRRDYAGQLADALLGLTVPAVQGVTADRGIEKIKREVLDVIARLESNSPNGGLIQYGDLVYKVRQYFDGLPVEDEQKGED
jgi:hypothetical protein